MFIIYFEIMFSKYCLQMTVLNRSLRSRFRSHSLSGKEIPEGKQEVRISEKHFLIFFNSLLQQQQPQAPPVAALLHLKWKSSQHKRNEKVKFLLSFFETFRNFFSPPDAAVSEVVVISPPVEKQVSQKKRKGFFIV